MASGHHLLAVPDADRSLHLQGQVQAKFSLGSASLQLPALDLVGAVRLAKGEMTIHLDTERTAEILGLAPGEFDTGCLVFTAPFQTRRRGVETKVVSGTMATSPDATLRQTLARAHRWTAELCAGKGLLDIASAGGHAESFIRTRAPFAFLSPKIQAAILNGTQPTDLSTERIARVGVPLDWAEQEKLFGFA